MEYLDKDTKKLLKESKHVFFERELLITTRMYEILFERYPATKKLFKEFRSQQPNVFGAAIMAHMTSIDDLEALKSTRAGIAQNHVKAGVKEEHYPQLAEALFAAMEEQLPGQMDEKTIKAWETWYWYLSNLLINRERDHYEGNQLLFPGDQ